MITNNYLSSNLKWLLKHHKITAAELARRCDLSQPVVHRLVVGTIDNPQIKTLLKIGDYFDCNIHSLFTESFEKIQTQQRASISLITQDRIKNALAVLKACSYGLERITPALIKNYNKKVEDPKTPVLSDAILQMLPSLLTHTRNMIKNLQAEMQFFVPFE